MSSIEIAPLATAPSKILVSAVPASIARVTNSVFSSWIDHSASSIFSLFCAPVLAQQYRAAAFQFLRKHRNGVAGAGDTFAMRLRFLGRAVDLGGIVADRSDKMRGGRDVVGNLAGGFVLPG